VESFLKKKEELFVQFYDLAADIEEKEGVEVTDGQVSKFNLNTISYLS
jgi:hypothetical protein